MKAKTIARVLVAGVAIPALVLGVPSVAMADSFFHADSQVVSHHGSVSHEVTAIAKSGHGHGHGHGPWHGGHGHGPWHGVH